MPSSKDIHSNVSGSNSPHYTLQENVSLKPYHTFGLPAKARFFCTINSEKALLALLKASVFNEYSHALLGEGSNTLFTRDFPGIVIRMNIKGIKILTENTEHAYLIVSAGENWQDFVSYTLERGFYGLENLSLIPGSVGAAPVQNIGAYGVEVKEIISQVHTIDITSGKKRVFENDECLFSYRDSRFKKDFSKRYIITAVTFCLRKKSKLNLNYAGLKEAMGERGISNPTALDVSNMICHLRKTKLPDPKKLANSGSFFKNPVVSAAHYFELQKEFPKIKSFKLENKKYKIPAGWLIEHCGLKGKNIGPVGVYKKQALVLINNGEASGNDVYRAISHITERVDATFGILLEVEPVLL